MGFHKKIVTQALELGNVDPKVLNCETSYCAFDLNFGSQALCFYSYIYCVVTFDEKFFLF